MNASTGPTGFSLALLGVLNDASCLAVNDALGSIAEAHAGSGLGPTLVSAAHLLSALEGTAVGVASDQPVTTSNESTAIVNRIIIEAAKEAFQEDAPEVTPDHLRAGLEIVLSGFGIDAAALRRVRERISRRVPAHLGVTALRHRDVSVRDVRAGSLTT